MFIAFSYPFCPSYLRCFIVYIKDSLEIIIFLVISLVTPVNLFAGGTTIQFDPYFPKYHLFSCSKMARKLCFRYQSFGLNPSNTCDYELFP